MIRTPWDRSWSSCSRGCTRAPSSPRRKWTGRSPTSTCSRPCSRISKRRSADPRGGHRFGKRRQPMKFRYSEWDEALAQRLRQFKTLKSLFHQLLLQTDGDVEEAFRWLQYLKERG